MLAGIKTRLLRELLDFKRLLPQVCLAAGKLLHRLGSYRPNEVHHRIEKADEVL